jgi:hypothetical protein
MFVCPLSCPAVWTGSRQGDDGQPGSDGYSYCGTIADVIAMGESAHAKIEETFWREQRKVYVDLIYSDGFSGMP